MNVLSDPGLGSLCTFTSVQRAGYGLIQQSQSQRSFLYLTFQVLMTFKLLAMTFTWEEWRQLDQDQKHLYQEVMMETCRHLVSLGRAHLSLPPFLSHSGLEKAFWSPVVLLPITPAVSSSYHLFADLPVSGQAL